MRTLILLSLIASSFSFSTAFAKEELITLKERKKIVKEMISNDRRLYSEKAIEAYESQPHQDVSARKELAQEMRHILNQGKRKPASK
jgi:vacuolar-type H+-ATPase subunit H